MRGDCLRCDEALSPDEHEYCDECLQEIETNEDEDDES